ncbi:MAG: hypothetical protein ACRC78_21650 [Planktothrix sp.]
MPIPLAAFIPAAVQGATGLIQLLSKKRVKPREVTAEQKTALANANNQAYGETPGMAQATNQLQTAQATTQRAIDQSGGDTSMKLAALSAAQANTNQGIGSLASQESAYKANQMQNLNQALNQMGEEKKAIEAEVAATKSALTGAAIQNIAGATQKASDAVLTNQMAKGLEGVAETNGQVDLSKLTPEQVQAYRRMLALKGVPMTGMTLR